MSSILGRVELRGQTFLEDTLIWLSEPTPDHTGVLTTWSGSFELPADLPTQKFIDFHNGNRNSCRIVFEDGRSGDIIVTNIHGMMPPATVEFLGAGQLK
jgi:hypothetical protein